MHERARVPVIREGTRGSLGRYLDWSGLRLWEVLLGYLEYGCLGIWVLVLVLV